MQVELVRKLSRKEDMSNKPSLPTFHISNEMFVMTAFIISEKLTSTPGVVYTMFAALDEQQALRTT